jgi:BON domain/CBS domain
LAAIMAEHGLNALPVLDAEGGIAGIISESDLIRKEEYQDDPAARRPPHSHHHRAQADGTLAGILTPLDLLKVYLRSDGEIRDEILGEVITNYLGCDPGRAEVIVTDGVVTLRGEVERKSMVPLAGRMARSVDGVVDVVNNLAYAVDDTHLPTAAELDEV